MGPPLAGEKLEKKTEKNGGSSHYCYTQRRQTPSAANVRCGRKQKRGVVPPLRTEQPMEERFNQALTPVRATIKRKLKRMGKGEANLSHQEFR